MIAGLFFALLLVFVYQLGRRHGYLNAINKVNDTMQAEKKMKAAIAKKGLDKKK